MYSFLYDKLLGAPRLFVRPIFCSRKYFWHVATHHRLLWKCQTTEWFGFHLLSSWEDTTYTNCPHTRCHTAEELTLVSETCSRVGPKPQSSPKTPTPLKKGETQQLFIISAKLISQLGQNFAVKGKRTTEVNRQINKSSCPISLDLFLPNLAFEFERIWLCILYCLLNPSASLLQPCRGLYLSVNHRKREKVSHGFLWLKDLKTGS